MSTPSTKRTISLPQPDEDAVRLARHQYQQRCGIIAAVCGGLIVLCLGAKLVAMIVEAATR